MSRERIKFHLCNNYVLYKVNNFIILSLYKSQPNLYLTNIYLFEK